MANPSTILWASVDLLKVLPIVKEFEPVFEWDNDSRSFSKTQVTENGVLVWESQALLKMGWGAELTPVKVRFAYSSKPKIAIDPAKLMAALGQSSTESGTDR